MQSTEINELAAALAKAQGEFSAVPKGSVNPFFKSKYADLSDVIRSAGPVLTAHGLAVSQFISEDDTLTTYLIHESGQFIAHRANLHLVKDDPQSAGSATTYARRYGYMSCLGLVADEDDDGNRASHSGPNEASRPLSRPERAQQAQQATRQAPIQGTEDPRIAVIVQASLVSDDDFIISLATQYSEKGRLTEKQMEAGFKKGSDILGQTRVVRPVQNEPRQYEYDEEPF